MTNNPPAQLELVLAGHLSCGVHSGAFLRGVYKPQLVGRVNAKMVHPLPHYMLEQGVPQQRQSMFREELSERIDLDREFPGASLGIANRARKE